MNEFQVFTAEQIKKIIPEYEKLELRATISDTSRSIEFFVTIKGERKQCYELVDEGIINDAALEKVFVAIADFARKTDGYKNGEVNKFSF